MKRQGLPALRPTALNRLDKLLPLNDLPENGVLAVEMRRGHGGDEELRAVGVGAGVRHAVNIHHADVSTS